MGNVTNADRAQLNHLYWQWRGDGNGPVGNDLHVAVWKFTIRQVGDDLGHDVCLRVVRHLNQLQGRQPAVLPEDLCAYLYGSCRNARKDLERETRKYVPLREEHLVRFRNLSNIGGHEDFNKLAVKEWLELFEKCKTQLPPAIVKLLDLNDIDLLTTLGAADGSSDAVKKRRQRAKRKCLLAFGAAALIGYPMPQPLVRVISCLCPSLRGGPWEKILAIAPRFRQLSPNEGPASATILVEAAQHRLSTFVRGVEDIGAFKDAYTWLRTAALLSPEVAADSHDELKSSFFRYRTDQPLIGRLLDRIYALSGNEMAAAEGNRFWHHCLARLRGDASYISESEALFGAVYVIAYYAEPGLSWPLVSLLQPLDWSGIVRFLKQHADKLRDSIIEQACANVAEEIYQTGPHAEVNFVRVQLGLTCLSRYSPRFGKGYSGLTSDTAMELAMIADHAARTTDNPQLKQTAEKIRGSLIYVYDVKWREFSRRCERARNTSRVTI